MLLISILFCCIMKRTNTLYISSKNKYIVYHWKYKMSSYHPNLSKSNKFNSNDTSFVNCNESPTSPLEELISLELAATISANYAHKCKKLECFVEMLVIRHSLQVNCHSYNHSIVKNSIPINIILSNWQQRKKILKSQSLILHPLIHLTQGINDKSIYQFKASETK
jgi:hypothetical protein